MLRQPLTQANLLATQTLAHAVTASASGKADDALAASALAITQFRAAQNHPGQLRAQAEHIYALQRSLRQKDCHLKTGALESQLSSLSYIWAVAFIKLEQSACFGYDGNLDESFSRAASAERLANEHNLPRIRLRANGFEATLRGLQERWQPMWEATDIGLSASNSLEGSGMLRYQFLNGFDEATKSLGLKWARCGYAAAALDAVLTSHNNQVATYSAEILAEDNVQVGREVEAQQAFALADSLLARLGGGPVSELYRADLEVARSYLTSKQKGPAAAIKALASQKTILEGETAFYHRLGFYIEYADRLREMNQPENSAESAVKAVEISEKRLAQMTNQTERDAWQLKSRRAYEVLILDLIQLNRSATAFIVSQALDSKIQSGIHHQNKPGIRQLLLTGDSGLPPSASSTLTIALARVGDKYMEWSISDEKLHPLRLTQLAHTSSELESLAESIRRLCGDPNSSISDINAIGSVLGQDLFEQIQLEVSRAKVIRIAFQGDLSRLPVAVIPFHGTPLGISHQIVTLTRLSLAQNSEFTTPKWNDEINPQRLGILILRQPAIQGSSVIPDQFNEGIDLARDYSKSRLEIATLSRDGALLRIAAHPRVLTDLRRAQIIQYTGHTPGSSGDDLANTASDFIIHPGTLQKCRLAVLAACSTKLERESERIDVPSIARLFLDSGAGAVLASQWDIDSLTTHSLTTRFYAELADHQPAQEALHRAEIATYSNAQTRHPHYWAPFELVVQ
jgi:hypothetical protein